VIGILNSRFRWTIRAAALASLLGTALLLAASAAAQTPTADQYRSIIHNSGGGGSGAGEPTGFLPFTGLDLAAMVVAAVALLAAGLALERFRRRHPAGSR
jgi:hypothetical protein